jgi:hypothetical protein
MVESSHKLLSRLILESTKHLYHSRHKSRNPKKIYGVSNHDKYPILRLDHGLFLSPNLTSAGLNMPTKRPESLKTVKVSVWGANSPCSLDLGA